MTVDINQPTKTKKLHLDETRLFHAVNGGIVTSFWVALANLLQRVWSKPVGFENMKLCLLLFLLGWLKN